VRPRQVTIADLERIREALSSPALPGAVTWLFTERDNQMTEHYGANLNAILSDVVPSHVTNFFAAVRQTRRGQAVGEVALDASAKRWTVSYWSATGSTRDDIEVVFRRLLDLVVTLPRRPGHEALLKIAQGEASEDRGLLNRGRQALSSLVVKVAVGLFVAVILAGIARLSQLF
jgi:hypothetical protein